MNFSCISHYHCVPKSTSCMWGYHTCQVQIHWYTIMRTRNHSHYIYRKTHKFSKALIFCLLLEPWKSSEVVPKQSQWTCDIHESSLWIKVYDLFIFIIIAPVLRCQGHQSKLCFIYWRVSLFLKVITDNKLEWHTSIHLLVILLGNHYLLSLK